MWIAAARLADGQSINIDHTMQSVGFVAPQDGRIAELNGKLNATYIPFGAEGRRRAELQERLDKLAESAQPGGGGQSERAMAKVSGFYRANTWDLVDAIRDGKVDLNSIKDEELSEDMRKMTPAEGKAFIEKKASERAKLQEEIRQLAAEREKYVAEERRKNALAAAKSFDEAVQDMLQVQLEKKGYSRNVK